MTTVFPEMRTTAKERPPTEDSLECAGSTALWNGRKEQGGFTKAVSSHRTP